MQLFPIPSQPPSAISPTPLPGVNPETTKALQNVLNDNHERHHAFFDGGFHNHVPHHVLAIWALGGDQNVINAAYGRDQKHQRKAYDSPEPITSTNFNDHLGDENFYGGYLKFFHDLIIVQQQDIPSVLERYVFSPEANFGTTSSDGKHPQMLSRFVDGLLHPMIHVGYGAELGLPGMIIEGMRLSILSNLVSETTRPAGLSQTAVHKPSTSPVIPPSMFTTKPVPSNVSGLTSRHASGDSDSNGTHAFTILARILKDPELKIREDSSEGIFVHVMKNHAETLFKHAIDWDGDTSDPKKVERKIAELQWMNTLIYVLPGFKRGQGDKFHADLYNMLLVTSSIFLPSIVALLSPPSQKVFLHSYFVTSLAWWISRGRPGLDIESFFAADTVQPDLGVMSPAKLSLIPDMSHPSATNPNPWLPIIQQAILSPDDHVPKFQRAMVHYAKLYGSRVACSSDFANTELPGADKLDGTLFVRAAGLTAKRLGRDFGGQDLLTYWDEDPFFED
ncbi:hypothetical protein K435DRAFT_777443 [Dendrothele bispora CBS 962.96]|uniref:Oxidoreductase AflY n=1 Tax=Dendrothele bispora (strain CBS 962.96) TaxID=1314807 RepID=A0A4S8M883_DENBC|nr:hypothetical protein K435DRAFT_777443 [Dendrothele bispora CBS 962.96]